MEGTKIGWCDNTFNGWIGCTKVSPGCDFCYAEGVSKHYKLAEWGPGAPRKRTSASYWRQPLKWDKRAEKNGRPELVFSASMADIADGEVPDEWRDDLMHLIGTTPNLRWLLLTKRPQALLNYLKGYIERNGGRNNCIPPNIWWGFTAEDQQRFDQRLPVMREIRRLVRRMPEQPIHCPECAEERGVAVPSECPHLDTEPILWMSAEPLIGPIRMGDGAKDVDWSVIGGESNSKRGMRPEWVYDLVSETLDAGNKPFVKQTGDMLAREWGLEKKKGDDPAEWPGEMRWRQWPDDAGDRS